MKKIAMAFLLCMIICVTGVAAQSVVALEGNESPFDLVYLSSDPTEIRAFQLYLQCDDDIVITKAEGEEPFQVFSGGTDEDGIFRISGFTTQSPGKSGRTVFAKIFTSGNGKITISVEVLSDFNREKIIPENQDESYLISRSTQSTTVTPTQISHVPSPTQTSTSLTPIMTSSPVKEETPIPTSTDVPLSPPSSPVGTTDPVSMPTKTPLGIVCSILGLSGAFIML